MYSANSLVLLLGVLGLVVRGLNGINHNAQPMSIAIGKNGSVGPDGIVVDYTESGSCERLSMDYRSLVDDLPGSRSARRVSRSRVQTVCEIQMASDLMR